MNNYCLGFIKNNQINKAIDLFHEIKNPDEVIVVLLFSACAKVNSEESLNLVKKVLVEMPQSFYSNTYVLTSLIDALMKCSDVKYAQLLFDKSTKKTIPVYGAMMKGFTYFAIFL